MWRFSEIRYLPDIVRYWAAERSGKVAVIEGEATRTYAELDARSNAIANHLAKLGVKKGDAVGYLGKNAVEVFEIWFAAAKLGCIFAPFNWRLAVDELVQIQDDARAPVVFVTAEMLDTLRAVENRSSFNFVIVDFPPSTAAGGGLSSWIDGVSRRDPMVPVTGTDITLLSYTSGTTGRPKGVMASLDAFNYSFLCDNLEPTQAWRDDDVMLASMPNFHLAGSWVPLAALYHGATISLLPAFDPQAFLTALRRDRPTRAPLVPTTIAMLLDHPDRQPGDFASMRFITYYGSPIGEQLLKRAIATMDCEFCQRYGATELWFATNFSHADHVAGVPGRLASCGVPLPMVSMKIVDDAGQEVPRGTIGELAVRSPMAMTGYRNRPDATAEALRGGWYYSGDMARMDEDGFIYLVDRKKDMIISGGENVYSAEVELALLKHPAIAMAAVIGTPDPVWGEKVTAVIVPAPGQTLTAEEVRQHTRSHLAGYKVPKDVHFETSLPLTPNGKVQKAPLRSKYRALAEA